MVSDRALENRRLRTHSGPITKAPFGGGREHRKKRFECSLSTHSHYKFRATLQCGVAASVIVLERSHPPNTASPKGSPIDVLAPSRCASICPPLGESSGESERPFVSVAVKIFFCFAGPALGRLGPFKAPRPQPRTCGPAGREGARRADYEAAAASADERAAEEEAAAAALAKRAITGTKAF